MKRGHILSKILFFTAFSTFLLWILSTSTSNGDRKSSLRKKNGHVIFMDRQMDT